MMEELDPYVFYSKFLSTLTLTFVISFCSRKKNTLVIGEPRTDNDAIQQEMLVEKELHAITATGTKLRMPVASLHPTRRRTVATTMDGMSACSGARKLIAMSTPMMSAQPLYLAAVHSRRQMRTRNWEWPPILVRHFGPLAPFRKI